MRGPGLALVALIFAAGPALAQPAGEAPEDYPDHPGREATFYSCTGCHGFRLVAAQALNRAQWDGVLELMKERHSMPKLDGPAREAILAYLAAAFAPRTLVPGRQSPFTPR